MSRRLVLREGEVRVISVTPVWRGVLRPVLFCVATIALVIVGGMHVHVVHEYQRFLLVVLAGPFALVSLTRVWRWRSHKVRVTNQRIILEGGVLHHRRSSVELADVIATRIDQRVSERLTRRGMLVLETRGGTIHVGVVRHPAALLRLIDAERHGDDIQDLPLDTVFTYHEPQHHRFDARPRAERHYDVTDWDA